MGDVVRVPQGGAVPVRSLPVARAVASALRSGLGISALFSAQAAVVRHVAAHPDRDVVLCAPTGSGKTLCYALPLLSRLSSRVVPRLRALVVVPTRDLAAQVARVLAALAADAGLRVALAVGASSVRREAAALEGCDVLVATPGRLVEHTRHTRGFSLAHVRFLVLDESDRLLHDSYYGWIDVVVPECGRSCVSAGDNRFPPTLAALATHRAPAAASGWTRRAPFIMLASATQTKDPKRLTLLDLRRPVHFVADLSPRTPAPGGDTAPAGAAGEGSVDFDREGGDGGDRDGSDDGDGDGDVDVDVDVGERTVYRVPDSLVERAYVLGQATEKPSALAKLLGLCEGALGGAAGVIEALPDSGSKLVFTSSVESAHRLTRLLELFASRARSEVPVLEMSGDLSAERRAAVVRAANRSTVVIVCSDVLARGMDIDGVDAVVSYDSPVHVNTYLHRVGRTARAERDGTAVSLVLGKQARHFKSMVRTIERGKGSVWIRSVKRSDEGFDVHAARVQEHLCALKRILRREQLGLLDRHTPLPAYVFREFSAKKPAVEAAPAASRRSFVHPDRIAAIEALSVGPEETEHEDDNGDEEESDEDSFQALIRCQVARNYLTAPS